jgi:MFS family permease
VNSELIRVIAGYSVMYASLAGTRIAAPLLVLTLGHGTPAAALLIALFALPQIVLAIPAARWADREALTRTIAWCAAVATLGTALAAAWPIYAVLCIAAVSVGAAMGAAAIALQRHVGRIAQTPGDRRRAFTWLSTAPPVANAIGALVAGALIDNVSYGAAFLALAVMPFVGWLGIRTVQPLPAEPSAMLPSANAWNLWREPHFRRLMLLNWFSAATFDAHNFLVPVLGHQRGLSASVIGTVVGSFAIATALVRLAMPGFVAEVREWKLIAAAMACAALFFLLYPFAPSPVAMAVCAAGLGASMGCVQPMVMSLVHHVTPQHRHGEAIAMRHLLINASTVAMPLLLGVTTGLVGIGGPFWLMGVVMGCGCRLSVSLRGA